jgi:hypothetical protein
MALLGRNSWPLSLLATQQQSDDFELSVLQALKKEGVATTSADNLFGTDAPRVRTIIAAAQSIVAMQPASKVPELWTRGRSSTDLKPEVLLSKLPQLYLLGLHESILQLVQRYLRAPLAYHGAVLRHSLLDGAAVGTRLWHQDAEDRHVFRMVLYLNDVAPGGGPFEYIPRHLGVSYRDFTEFSHAITNERMDRIVPSKMWKRVLGPSGTFVLADTAKTFHHESLQVTAERAVVMFGFSTRRPRDLSLASGHFPVERFVSELQALVPAHNRDQVFAWRGLA